MSRPRFDVLVIGEPLLELLCTEQLGHGASLRMSFSGDALNAAGAAAAAGARVALLTRLGDDELGAAMVARMSELGIDTSLVRLVAGENGAYLRVPGCARSSQFAYMRRGSAATRLSAADVEAVVAAASVVVATGVTQALSRSARAAVVTAARRARRFVYDPNFRSRLTTPAAARRALADVLEHCELVLPSCPSETSVLLETEDPAEAAARCEAGGAKAVAVTQGSAGVLVVDGGVESNVHAPTPHRLVDEAGAGDSLLGTVAARLALGDDLLTAVRHGAAAASRAVAADGGAGHL